MVFQHCVNVCVKEREGELGQCYSIYVLVVVVLNYWAVAVESG